jgi:hypothetical protein
MATLANGPELRTSVAAPAAAALLLRDGEGFGMRGRVCNGHVTENANDYHSSHGKTRVAFFRRVLEHDSAIDVACAVRTHRCVFFNGTNARRASVACPSLAALAYADKDSDHKQEEQDDEDDCDHGLVFFLRCRSHPGDALASAVELRTFIRLRSWGCTSRCPPIASCRS